MGSKKHKKHHKSEKRDVSFEGERQEKPLKLVLKVAGSSIQAPPPPPLDLVPAAIALQQLPPAASECLVKPVSQLSQEQKPGNSEKDKSSSHSHEKHKKSKKKKKKKSSEKDKDRHDKKRKHHRHHHHHREHSHDRKEKRKREQQELSRSVIESHEDANILQKTSMIDAQVPVAIEKPLLRGPRTCTLKKKTLKTPLQIMLYYIMKKLQLKDPQDFFAWPVTDTIAPGYSDIIKNPIDFSTIKKKIDDREYGTVTDFKNDIKLMCDNAMTYNGPDTIYFKSARRMWHAAQKIMSRDQLISLKQTLPYLSELTEKELGIDASDQSEISLPKTEITSEPSTNLFPEAKKTKVAPRYWNNADMDGADDDDLCPEDILATAQKAAKAAAEKLTLKRPNSTLGFLRQQENGTTTLNIVHPRAGDYPQSMKVNLQMLTGKLGEGTGTIIGFSEDPKNIIKPVSYTNYGAYHSYAPHYDSMFANLSKEDSDLLISTYGDETGVQYADSITTYSKDSDYILNMVDNLLDVLTGGEHSKTVKILEERRKIREEEQMLKNSEISAMPAEQKNNLQNSAEQAEAESIQALNDIDMEMSMLETSDADNSNKRKAEKLNKSELLQKHKKLLTQRKAIQQKLDNATQLLQDLRKVQNERLSAPPPSHLSLVPSASPMETDLADRFTKKIADIASQLLPESVANVDGLRKAMGISSQVKPVQDVPSSHIQTNVVSGNKTDRSKVKANVSYKVNNAVQSNSPFEPSSPAQIPNENRASNVEIDNDLQQFLETGPMLHVCDSPTGP